jgi:hypothetical protein
LYYYYSKKKAREKAEHSSGHVTDVTSGQGRFWVPVALPEKLQKHKQRSTKHTHKLKIE